MENRYLEYQVLDGYVVKIYNELPIDTPTDRKIAISSNLMYEVGYEFDNYIVVQEVDVDGNLISACMIKQPDSVKFLRQERDRLVIENTRLANNLMEVQMALAMMMGI